MFSGVTWPDARRLIYGSCPWIIDPIPLDDSVSITHQVFIVSAALILALARPRGFFGEGFSRAVRYFLSAPFLFALS